MNCFRTVDAQKLEADLAVEEQMHVCYQKDAPVLKREDSHVRYYLVKKGRRIDIVMATDSEMSEWLRQGYALVCEVGFKMLEEAKATLKAHLDNQKP